MCISNLIKYYEGHHRELEVNTVSEYHLLNANPWSSNIHSIRRLRMHLPLMCCNVMSATFKQLDSFYQILQLLLYLWALLISVQFVNGQG